MNYGPKQIINGLEFYSHPDRGQLYMKVQVMNKSHMYFEGIRAQLMNK